MVAAVAPVAGASNASGVAAIVICFNSCSASVAAQSTCAAEKTPLISRRLRFVQ